MAMKSGHWYERDVRSLNTAELKFICFTTGYSLLEHRRNYIFRRI